jgi:AcrR family transcriptional regulator
MDTAARKRASYHHGDLPTALVDAALELVAENGVQGFSVAEAARRTGVSISAPYRHFADRDELLAAVGARGYAELLVRFEAAMASEAKPADQLAALCATYVRFAAERRPMFEVLFGAGLEKAKYPALEAAAHQVMEAIAGVALQLTPGRDEEAAGKLMQALAALAQGHASMLLESGLPFSEEAVEDAAERAAAAARALVRGRSELFA